MKLLTVILVILLALLQYRLWFGKNSWPDYLKLKKEIEVQEQLNAELKKRNQLHYKEIADLQDGLHAVEERSRNELGMIKEGEQFYRIVE